MRASYIVCAVLFIFSFNILRSYFNVSLNLVTVPNVQILIYFVTQLLYSPPPAAGLHQAMVPIH